MAIEEKDADSHDNAVADPETIDRMADIIIDSPLTNKLFLVNILVHSGNY
jgi:hypothetical protein